MALREFSAHVTQAVKGFAAGVAQAHTGLGELQPTALLDKQADPKVLFEHFELPADGAVSDVQLLGGEAHAVQAGSGLEGAQGIQGGKVAAHGICEFS